MDSAKDRDFPNAYLHVVNAHLLEGTATWTNKKLSAPFWRLYWNLNANAAIHLRGKTVELDPATVALIPPFSAFDKSSKGAVAHFHVHFIAGPPFDSLRDNLFSFPITAEIRSLCKRVIPVIALKGDRDPWVIARLAWYVFWALNKIPWEAIQKTPDDPRIERVIRLISENAHRPLSNERLAREFSMNTNAFIRFFKRTTGVSPHRYYLDKRIEKACILLHSTSETIEEIASETGFADRFHFSRVFAGIVGTGPAAYRSIKT
jgi:AraC-like DNA-binding protein